MITLDKSKFAFQTLRDYLRSQARTTKVSVNMGWKCFPPGLFATDSVYYKIVIDYVGYVMSDSLYQTALLLIYLVQEKFVI